MILAVNARLTTPFFTDTDGSLMAMKNDLTPISYALPDECDHTETMCEDCIDSWEADWRIESLSLINPDGVVTVPWEGSGLS